MSSLKDKLKKLSFFTHYPKKHETLTINNNSEEFSSKEEIWGEWFTNDYTNGIWMFNGLCVIIKFIGKDFIGHNDVHGDFSDSIVDWGDGTIGSPSQLAHTYETTGEHTIIITNFPHNTDNCFFQCNLTSIIVPPNITSLGDSCFGSCTSLTNIIIPSSVTSIGNNCFRLCTNLTNITIPSSVISLGSSCFYGCTSLTNVTIPSSVTSLASGCFYECASLTNITIPSSITSLGGSCFSGCTSLTNVILNWTSSDKIVTYKSNWIANTNTQLKFIIPSGTTSLYTAKGYPSNKLEER